MKRLFALAATLAFASGSAFAFHCPSDMKAIDAALAKKPKLTEAQAKSVDFARSRLHATLKQAAGENLALLGSVAPREFLLKQRDLGLDFGELTLDPRGVPALGLGALGRDLRWGLRPM